MNGHFNDSGLGGWGLQCFQSRGNSLYSPKGPLARSFSPMSFAMATVQLGICFRGGRATVFYGLHYRPNRASQVVLVVKNPPTNAGDIRDMGSIPASGRSPGRGRGNPLQYSCLENPMDRGAWQVTVQKVAKSWTWLKQLSMHAQMHTDSITPGNSMKEA